MNDKLEKAVLAAGCFWRGKPLCEKWLALLMRGLVIPAAIWQMQFAFTRRQINKCAECARHCILRGKYSQSVQTRHAISHQRHIAHGSRVIAIERVGNR